MMKISLIIIIICFSGIINWDASKCAEQTSTSSTNKEEDCTIVYPIGTTEDYKCCFVSYKKNDETITLCKVLPYDYAKLKIIERETFGNVKEVDIQCSGHYLIMGSLIIIMLLL